MSQIVQVRVEEIRSAGIFVRLLDDDREGFIPRREISWDRSVRNAAAEPAVGDQMEALVLASRHQDGNVMLSLRRMTDPWIGVRARYTVGQRVRGEVVNVRHNAAYVQLDPGIDAVVWSREMPLKSGQLPTEVLEVGDHVVGIVTMVDEENQKAEISLWECLRKLPREPEERIAVQCELVSCVPSDIVSTDRKVTEAQQTRTEIHHPPISGLQRIIVVDDDPDDLAQTVQWLEEAYGVDIDGARSGDRALELVEQGNQYSIAVIDVRLGNHHGGRVAEHLFEIDHDLAFVFVSSDPQAETEVDIIGGQRHLFSIKQRDSVIECVDKLCVGYLETIWFGSQSRFVREGGFAERLGISARLRRPLNETLADLLHQLRSETGVRQTMVIATKAHERAAFIVASSPALPADVQRLSQDGLYFSPVSSVAEYGEEVEATNIRQDIDARFKNFFPLLAISTCFGIPLTSPDLSTGYALFLLDERLTEFSDKVKANAHLAVPFLETALERAELFEVMQRYEQRYTHGLLLGSLNHELHAKLRGMGGQLQRLEGMLAQLELPLQPSAHRDYVQKASDATKKLRRAKSSMSELIDAYARLVRGEFEAVDVNAAVKKAVSQLGQYARDSGVELFFEFGHPMPPAEAIGSRLEQIVINLVLNAIQQIKRQREFFQEVDRQHKHFDDPAAFVPVGFVTVRTFFSGDESSHPIKIIVSDTGPGIHYGLERRLFQLNTSTRASGQGLGLYISRNLADFMDCHLGLVDSALFVGSSFALELRQRS